MGLFSFFSNKIKRENKKTDSGRPEGLAVLLGASTGELSNRGHKNGIWGDQYVWLGEKELCQNICIMGGIGAGKTTRAINPILSQLLFQNIGGLIFDIKGDFWESVDYFAEEAGREVQKIGIGHKGVNLLKGLPPEMAASFLQNTFILINGKGNDQFWLSAATDLCRAVLGILETISHEHGSRYYALDYLYEYVFMSGARSKMNDMLHDIIDQLDTTSSRYRQINNYLNYYDEIFLTLDSKLQESIKATLSTVLTPFQNPELVDAFSGSDTEEYDLMNILNGDIVVVDLPLSRWGVGGKVIYTFIKLRFFNFLQLRQADRSLPQVPTFFMCDEYQEIVSAANSGLSDLSFWDKSRSSRCMGIISTQSVSAFRSAIGNHTLSDTVLSNFRQKVFFRTEDDSTIKMMQSITGRVEIIRESRSESQGQSNGGIWGIFTGAQPSNSQNSCISTNIVDQILIDANLVRQLDDDHCLSLLNIEGSAADDVLYVEPYYVN